MTWFYKYIQTIHIVAIIVLKKWTSILLDPQKYVIVFFGGGGGGKSTSVLSEVIPPPRECTVWGIAPQVQSVPIMPVHLSTHNMFRLVPFKGHHISRRTLPVCICSPSVFLFFSLSLHCPGLMSGRKTSVSCHHILGDVTCEVSIGSALCTIRATTVASIQQQSFVPITRPVSLGVWRAGQSRKG